MYYIAAAVTVSMIAFAMEGCKSSSLIYPQERVVAEAEKTDFGLVGTWRGEPDHANPYIDIKEEFSISMSSEGVYSLKCKGLEDYTITLRASELVKDSGYAIVDVDIVANDKFFCRYLVVATRRGDELYVWWIESRNIAAKLHESGYAGVVEHGTMSTRVHARPADLLDCVRKHSKELVSEPARFQLVKR